MHATGGGAGSAWSRRPAAAIQLSAVSPPDHGNLDRESLASDSCSTKQPGSPVMDDSAPPARTIADRARAAMSWQTVDEIRAELGDARVLVLTSAPLSVELEAITLPAR